MKDAASNAASRTVQVTITSSTVLDRDVDHVPGNQKRITHTVQLSSASPTAVVEHSVLPQVYQQWMQQEAHDSLLFSVTGRVQQTGQMYATFDALPAVKLTVAPLQLELQRQQSNFVVVQVGWVNPQLEQLCGCSVQLHLVGSDKTSTQSVGCLSKDAQMKMHSKFAVKKDQKASVNAMMNCANGISASGFVSE